MCYRLPVVFFPLPPGRYRVHREHAHEEICHDCFELSIGGKVGKNGFPWFASGSVGRANTVQTADRLALGLGNDLVFV